MRDYYGEVLQSNQDLKTSACCPTDSLPNYQKTLLAKMHPTVLERFYGCGSPIAPALQDQVVLDLGCGTGRDSFLMAALGAKKVIGIDMTDSQLEVARSSLGFHLDVYKLAPQSLDFIRGEIEDLKALGIQDHSIDVVTSNCVINLSDDKEKVFKEIFRVLKPGGELIFSDVFSSRRLSASAKKDPTLVGECLGGAMYIEDFRRLMAKCGVDDYRTLSTSPISLKNAQFEDLDLISKIAGVEFFSKTIRAFKMPLEDRCEDFGQVAIYRGGIEHHEFSFLLDDHHLFEKNRPMLVCGNTADMLGRSRYGRFFEISGNKEQHFGIFDCVPAVVQSNSQNLAAGCC